jgi:hypothetical protein
MGISKNVSVKVRKLLHPMEVTHVKYGVAR